MSHPRKELKGLGRKRIGPPGLLESHPRKELKVNFSPHRPQRAFLGSHPRKELKDEVTPLQAGAFVTIVASQKGIERRGNT